MALVVVAGCVSERGESQLADLASAHPALDDLELESGRRIEIVRFPGSDSPGYAEPPKHQQRYVARDSLDLDDVYDELVAVVEAAGFERTRAGSDCHEAINLSGLTDTARIMRFRSGVTTPPDAHVLLSLRADDSC